VDLSLVKPVVLKTTKLDATVRAHAAAKAAAPAPAVNHSAGLTRTASSDWKF